MTEPEKMEVLKRAYAETILNTAKEAAARVMAAELRARRLEQDLFSTKEEAFRMLLRLKQMIDAKTKEAEVTSFNQQRKCDELESQLNEAEGIIVDLRAELNLANEQLDESKNNKLLSVRQNENAEVCNMVPNDTYTSNEHLKSSVNSGPGNNSCLNWSKLDQIKEPELLRNGCTQRICATETSLVHEKLPVGSKPNPSNQSNNFEIKNAVDNSELEERNQHGKNGSVSVVRRSVRKRKLKFWDDVISACGLSQSYQFKKARQDFRCDNTSKVKKCAKPGGDEFQAEHETQVEPTLDCAQFNKIELTHTDVSVKQGELATATTKSSNLSHADGEKTLKYTFSRKSKRKSVIYPEKSSSFGESLLSEENSNPVIENSSLLTESYKDSTQLVQVAHQLIALSGSTGDI